MIKYDRWLEPIDKTIVKFERVMRYASRRQKNKALDLASTACALCIEAAPRCRQCIVYEMHGMDCDDLPELNKLMDSRTYKEVYQGAEDIVRKLRELKETVRLRALKQSLGKMYFTGRCR